MDTLFEKAVRGKYRFPFKGMITVEDLWDLSLPGLDSVFKQLNKQKKVNEEESLLAVKSEADIELENKIQIVRYIVECKQNEAMAKLVEKENKAHNQKILEIIERKQNKELENMSIEELQKQLK